MNKIILLTTTGDVTFSGVEVATPLGCGSVILKEPTALQLNSVVCYTVFSNKSAQFYPNPFSSSLNVTMDGLDSNSAELIIYNSMESVVLKTTLSEITTTTPMSFSPGIYYYQLNGKDGSQQSGKLMSK